jgi:N-acetyl-gamma-glutamyl-phosphate reductase
VLKVAIVGASGYTAAELIRLLANHPKVEITGLYARKNVGRRLAEVHPQLQGFADDAVIEEPNYERVGSEADLVFFATPHGIAMRSVPRVLEGKAKVIDLSADYRFEDPKVYERYYEKHESPGVKGVYGLPELHRAEIRDARLVANPGCYPVAAVLALAPAIKHGLVDLERLVVDAKSGTSGAGATPSEVTHHPTTGSNIRAYSATTHRHQPEISQELSKLAGEKIEVCFTPHLIPVVRGILATAHVFFKAPVEQEELVEVYRKFYVDEPFVRVRAELPQTSYVLGSNYCDVGVEVAPGKKHGVIVAAIDNLVKGASGQAVQNMNLMCGFDEREGLRGLPLRP